MFMRDQLTRIALAVCLLCVACLARAYAQQPDAGATVSQQFFDAIKQGDAARVRALLKQDAALARAVTPKGTTATLLAVYADHKEIAELLIASGVEPNIFEAAATGRVERVRELLKQQPELAHDYSSDGWTALHLNFGNLEVVKLLLESGADINAVSKNKFVATPLQGAAAAKRLDVARLLLTHGAKVNTRGEGGDSPLHEVAANGQIEFARLLLEHGADVNAKDDDGKTPLTIALAYKQPEMAKFLREHGAAQ
jgi:uncharacterized protein